MMRTFYVLLALAAFTATTVVADKKMQMKDLPPAVQKTVQEQTKGAEIKGISKEIEKGKTQYEVETLVGGKARDFVVDTKGVVVQTEEEIALDTIPAAAKAAIEKKTAGGKISRVELLTGGGRKSYEAAYTKGGKKLEVTVNADGSETH